MNKEILDRLKEDYSYHTPTKEQEEDMKTISAAYLDLATKIVQLTPYTRQQSLALSLLEESSMYAKKAIYLHERK